MAEQMDLDLDPKRVLESINQLSKGVADLANRIEESLGKDAAKSFQKFEETTEKGAGKIASIFRDLKNRVKEDLKTAFDVGAVLGGAKLASDLGAGVKQVFEMEKAFDRLNTRLGLSGKALMAFKREMGGRIAGTGQTVESVMPGVDAAARGGVKNSEHLSMIAESLGRARAITGEETGGLSESIVEILQKQGRKITGKSFSDTLDAVMGTKVSGNFRNANEAAHTMAEMASSGKALGLNTRDLGGLAAAASASGSAGTGILSELIQRGRDIGGQKLLNTAFGTELFKNGQLDTKAFANIKKDQNGEYSKQIMSMVSGIGGSTDDLSRFIEAMKDGAYAMNKVAVLSDETADQFKKVENTGLLIDEFKESVKKGTRDLGDSFSNLAHGAMHGDLSGASDVGTALKENAGPMLVAAGISAVAALGSIGAFRRLMGKFAPSAGGLLGGAVTGQAAKAAGAMPVYVINFAEFGGGGAGGGLFGGIGGSVLGGAGAAAIIPFIPEILAAVAVAAAGSYVYGQTTGYWDKKEKEGDTVMPDGHILTHEALSKAIEVGTVNAHEKINIKIPPKLNPSAVMGVRVAR